MMNVLNIIHLIQIIFFILTILLAIIYIIPILFIRRFHNVNNVFTVNLCVAAICCCTYWLFYYFALEFNPLYLLGTRTCVTVYYFQMMCTLEVPLALVESSVHRLCSVVYHTKIFFKKKRWAIICIVSQWTIGIIFSIPQISLGGSVRNFN